MSFLVVISGIYPDDPNKPHTKGDPRGWWYSRADAIVLCETEKEVEAAWRTVQAKNDAASAAAEDDLNSSFDEQQVDVFEIIDGEAHSRGYSYRIGYGQPPEGIFTLLPLGMPRPRGPSVWERLRHRP